MNKLKLKKLIQSTIKEFIEEELNFDNIAQDIDFEEIPDDKLSNKTTDSSPKQDTTTKQFNFKDKINIDKQSSKLKNIDKKLAPKPVKLKDI